MGSQEGTSLPTEGSEGENEEPDTEPKNDESDQDPSDDPSERKEFHVHEPELEPGEEDAVLGLWGRFESLTDTEPFAVYMEFDALDPETPDEDEEELPRELELRENLVAVLSSEEKTRYDPSLNWDEFYARLINYNVASRAIPEATLEKYRSTLENYANEARIQWLNEFVDSGLDDEIENWLDALRDEFFSPDLGYYDLHLQFVDPGQKTRDDRENDRTSTGQPSESDEKTDSTASVKVDYVTNPSDGVPASSLSVGQEVYFRIRGETAEQLPPGFVDQDSSEPRSVPMVGMITSLEEQPEEARHLDSDPEHYRKISVEIEPTITGSALVFKDDHIKVPRDSTEQSIENRDLLLFGLILCLILVLVLIMIFFL